MLVPELNLIKYLNKLYCFIFFFLCDLLRMNQRKMSVYFSFTLDPDHFEIASRPFYDFSNREMILSYHFVFACIVFCYLSYHHPFFLDISYYFLIFFLIYRNFFIRTYCFFDKILSGSEITFFYKTTKTMIFCLLNVALHLVTFVLA